MKFYKTEVTIWSAIGNTPITKRNGNYCDEMFKFVIECSTPESAKRFVKTFIAETKDCDSGYFNMIDYPNNNLRNQFVR